ncbi:MAG: polysaccharide lyase family protein, partial [Limisphaerales bacterium]
METKLILLFLAALNAAAADPHVLWSIGKPDHNNAELALAPSGYAQFDDDAYFVVGKSDAKRDWPYVQPGPEDGWAGGRTHTFTIVFGVDQPGTNGACELVFDLMDTQSKAPPKLHIDVNGHPFERQMPAGAGDDSVNGNPSRGRSHHFEIEFPAGWLGRGNNKLTIAAVSGSWLLYDCLALETPPGITGAPVIGPDALQI